MVYCPLCCGLVVMHRGRSRAWDKPACYMARKLQELRGGVKRLSVNTYQSDSKVTQKALLLNHLILPHSGLLGTTPLTVGFGGNI